MMLDISLADMLKVVESVSQLRPSHLLLVSSIFHCESLADLLVEGQIHWHQMFHWWFHQTLISA